MKPISIFLDCLDNIVEPFTQAVGTPELEEIQNAKSSTVEHLDVIEDFFNTAFPSTVFPLTQFGACLPGIHPAENNPQILLEDIRSVQCFVCGQAEQVFEPDTLRLLQIFPWAQKQIAGTFQKASPLWWKFALEPSTNIVDSQAQRLDNMKMIVDDFDARTTSPDFCFIGVVHVNDHASKSAASFLAKPAEELSQGCSVAVSSHPNNAVAFQIGYNRQVAMPFFLGHFVDTQNGNSVQVPLSQQTNDMANFSILDCPPISSCPIGYIFQCRTTCQLKQPPLVPTSTSRLGTCYWKRNPTNSTLRTVNSMSTNPQPDFMRTDIQISQTNPYMIVVMLERPATPIARPFVFPWFQPNFKTFLVVSFPCNYTITLKSQERIDNIIIGHPSVSWLKIVTNNLIPERGMSFQLLLTSMILRIDFHLTIDAIHILLLNCSENIPWKKPPCFFGAGAFSKEYHRDK